MSKIRIRKKFRNGHKIFRVGGILSESKHIFFKGGLMRLCYLKGAVVIKFCPLKVIKV